MVIAIKLFQDSISLKKIKLFVILFVRPKDFNRERPDVNELKNEEDVRTEK